MPIVRDGRNRVDEYETVPPPANPSGPVERSRVSEARMADFAAERAATTSTRQRKPAPAVLDDQARATSSRARGAQRAGFVKGTTKPYQVKPTEEELMPAIDAGPVDARVPRGRPRTAEQLALILSTVREGGHAAAAERLGMTYQAIANAVSKARKDGVLPADLDELLRERSRNGRRGAAAPELEAPQGRPTAERPARGVGPAPAEVGASAAPEAPSRAGLTDAEYRRALKAANDITAPVRIEPQGGEEGAPATAAVDLGATASPAAEGVATPPSPPGKAEEEEPVAVGVLLTIDVTALARAMNAWPTYQINSFFDGLANVVRAASA